MRELNVNTGVEIYPIYIENDFYRLAEVFTAARLNNRKIAVVTDSNVSQLYLKTVVDALAPICSDITHTIYPAGEENKNLNTINHIYQFFVEKELDRGSVVVALGGGVTGDMAGFAAATFLRGIPYVQIPTTLLAQVDSSVGGKTGVDFAGNKNFVGAFYQPKLVYININTLKTLDHAEISAGMGEVIKHGFIRSLDYYRFLMHNKDGILSLDEGSIAEVVYGSCKIKSEVVSLDEKEAGIREILNFGHTFGHAVESLSEFSILHGHCVAHGMRAALFLSHKKGYISTEDFREALSLMDNFNMPSGLTGYNAEQICTRMLADKKTRNGNLRLVLLDRLGNAYTDNSVDSSDIQKAAEFMICPNRNGE